MDDTLDAGVVADRKDTASRRRSINTNGASKRFLRLEAKNTKRRSGITSDPGSRKYGLGRESPSRNPPKRPTTSGVSPAGSSNITRYERLWTPDDDTSAELLEQSSTQGAKSPPNKCNSSPANRPCEIIKQPEMRPMSQEQLVAAVKGIYAGLVMVERKCIEVDEAQSTQIATAAKLADEQWKAFNTRYRACSVESKCVEVDEAPQSTQIAATKLNGEPWRPLIALHRTTLHEHHDFFLASQHPSHRPAPIKLAAKHAPRRGIPGIPLYDSAPVFENTWTECLGDLGRYRMAIEVHDTRDREVWTSVSRDWYSRASDPVVPATPMDPVAAVSSPRREATPNPTLPHRLHCNLRTLLPFVPPFLLSLLPLIAATQPHAIPHRTAKILLTSLSALTSFSSGMTSLQLPNPTRPQYPTNWHNTTTTSQLTKPALRIACSTSLAFLVLAYTLWFLNIGGGGGWEARRKKRAFLMGFWVCSIVCWVFVRPSTSGFAAPAPVPAPAPAPGAGAGGDGTGKGVASGGEGDDGFVWLDGVNLFGLVAVVVGILNAEGGLFGALFSSSSSSSAGGGQAQGEDGDGGEEGDGREGRRIDEGESQGGGRRRRVADDEESQTPGGGRREDGEDSGDVGLGVLSVASHMFGA